MLLMILTGWLERQEREALAYLIEENRCAAQARRTTCLHGHRAVCASEPRPGGFRGLSRGASGSEWHATNFSADTSLFSGRGIDVGGVLLIRERDLNTKDT